MSRPWNEQMSHGCLYDYVSEAKKWGIGAWRLLLGDCVGLGCLLGMSYAFWDTPRYCYRDANVWIWIFEQQQSKQSCNHQDLLYYAEVHAVPSHWLVSITRSSKHRRPPHSPTLPKLDLHFRNLRSSISPLLIRGPASPVRTTCTTFPSLKDRTAESLLRNMMSTLPPAARSSWDATSSPPCSSLEEDE